MRRSIRAVVVGFAIASGALNAEEKPAIAMKTATKTISYRGGIVTFSIPQEWHEEYDPDGGGTFYEDRPNSGTLRLNVLSFSSKDKPAQQMALSVFPADSYQLLANGFPIHRYVKDATEKNELLHIHRWEVAVPVPPQSVRLVMFAHTVLASQEKDPRTKAELAFIEDSVQKAAFSQVAGVAGTYRHE